MDKDKKQSDKTENSTQSPIQREVQSQLIISHLFNCSQFFNQSKNESTKIIDDNKKLSTLYSVWLNNIKEKLKSSIKLNKQKLELETFVPKNEEKKKNQHKTSKEFSNNIFPEPKIFAGYEKEHFKDILFKIIETNHKKERKKRGNFSFEKEDFSIEGVNHQLKQIKLDKENNSLVSNTKEDQKMDTIIEQPSREEKDNPKIIEQNICDSSLSNHLNISTIIKDFVNNNSSVINGNIVKPIAPSQNVTNPKPSNKAFTFSKFYTESNNIIQGQNMKMIPQTGQPQNKVAQQIIPKLNPINTISNISNFPSSQLIISKEEDKKFTNESNWEYEITDNSDSEYEEDDSIVEIKNRKIQKWAKDKQFIKNTIQNQNKNKAYLQIFGKCKIDHLNLNMIFYSNNEKYAIRNSTADWRLDSTISPITGVNEKINFINNTENNKYFPNTNRQLNF